MTDTIVAANRRPPGWYDCPVEAGQLRWWDGHAWSDHTYAVDSAGTTPAGPPEGWVQPEYHRDKPKGSCEVCGALPAVTVRLRVHYGMMLRLRTLSQQGRWCRHCGLARFREAQRRTLLSGWWGIVSLLLNTVVLVRNGLVLRRLLALDEPRDPVFSPLPAQRTVWLSPGILATLLLPTFIAWWVVPH